MQKHENNFAFIDSQNLNLSIRNLGWQLDFEKFRIYLKEKYSVTRAYLFMGYIPTNHRLYARLQDMGYVCIFKPTLQYPGEKIKGNCDAELVLQSMIDFDYYQHALVVTGDGDFHCLIKYLISQNKLEKLLIPNQQHYSSLLRRFPSEYLAFVSHLYTRLHTRKER